MNLNVKYINLKSCVIHMYIYDNNFSMMTELNDYIKTKIEKYEEILKTNRILNTSNDIFINIHESDLYLYSLIQKNFKNDYDIEIIVDCNNIDILNILNKYEQPNQIQNTPPTKHRSIDEIYKQINNVRKMR